MGSGALVIICNLLCTHTFKASKVNTDINFDGYYVNRVANTVEFLDTFLDRWFLFPKKSYFSYFYFKIRTVASVKEILSNSSFDLRQTQTWRNHGMNDKYNTTKWRQSRVAKLNISSLMSLGLFPQFTWKKNHQANFKYALKIPRHYNRCLFNLLSFSDTTNTVAK